jgi:two-component system, cell cycle sensor histidine kinase and response regulator CckA
MQAAVVSVGQIVLDLRKMLGPLIGETIEIAIDLEPSDACASVDPSQLAQVVINLALNARDAMPAGGHLTIGTEIATVDARSPLLPRGHAPGRYVHLFVRDTGTGIDDAARERIFEPFFTTKEPGKGTGLGLSVAYGIVEQSQGFITVDSEPGQGTTFSIYLPMVDQPRAERHGQQISLLSGRQQRLATVLVVEDEDAVRRLIAKNLASLGLTVLTASDGVEACQLAQQHQGPIDILLTDVVMPRMGGAETMRRITALRPEIKPLYMTGYSSRGQFKRDDLGSNVTVLSKPFAEHTLENTLIELLNVEAKPNLH